MSPFVGEGCNVILSGTEMDKGLWANVTHFSFQRGLDKIGAYRTGNSGSEKPRMCGTIGSLGGTVTGKERIRNEKIGRTLRSIEN